MPALRTALMNRVDFGGFVSPRIMLNISRYLVSLTSIFAISLAGVLWQLPAFRLCHRSVKLIPHVLVQELKVHCALFVTSNLKERPFRPFAPRNIALVETIVDRPDRVVVCARQETQCLDNIVDFWSVARPR